MTATLSTAPLHRDDPVAGERAEPVVETRGRRTTDGGVVALDRLDRTVPRAAVGLLGANGASNGAAATEDARVRA